MTFSNRKVGGIRFLKVGRVNVSVSVSKPRVHQSDRKESTMFASISRWFASLSTDSNTAALRDDSSDMARRRMALIIERDAWKANKSAPWHG